MATVLVQDFILQSNVNTTMFCDIRPPLPLNKKRWLLNFVLFWTYTIGLIVYFSLLNSLWVYICWRLLDKCEVAVILKWYLIVLKLNRSSLCKIRDLFLFSAANCFLVCDRRSWFLSQSWYCSQDGAVC